MKHSFSIKEIRKHTWIKHGSGDWQVLLSCYFGHQYTKTLKDTFGVGMGKTILVTRNGYSATISEKEGLSRFGMHLAKMVEKDKKVVSLWCSGLKKEADHAVHVIKKLRKNPFGEQQFKEYVDVLYRYVALHQAVKQVVNYLSPKFLEAFMPAFKEARQYAEEAYEQARDYAYEFAEGFEKQTKYPGRFLLCLTEAELEKYFKTGKLVSKKILEKRLKASAVLFENGKYEVVTGAKVDEIERAMHSQEHKGEISGMPAYLGCVRGVVKIVFKPEDADDFKEGDILVGGNTRPYLLPVIQKAGAIVTEAGGLLSHAAIMAREFKKPTIVGAIGATTIFKNGDHVEVDANKGIVRKISK